MKCSDYRKLCAQVREIEFSELKRAVEAHGGLYRFDEDERPVVMMNRDFGPEDVSVCQVSVNESGFLCMTGIPKEDISEIEVDPDEVAIGHVDFILRAAALRMSPGRPSGRSPMTRRSSRNSRRPSSPPSSAAASSVRRLSATFSPSRPGSRSPTPVSTGRKRISGRPSTANATGSSTSGTRSTGART